MASSYTVDELVEDTLEHCGAVAGGFISTAQVLKYLRREADKLTSLLIKVHGARYFARYTTVATQGGLSLVSLPADFLTVLKVQWVKSSDNPVDLELAAIGDYTPLNSAAAAWNAPPRYDLQHNSLVLFPCPNAVYTLGLFYTSRLTLGASGTSVDLQPSWADALTLGAAVRITRKEKRDTTELIVEREAARQAILDQQASRDAYGLQQVADERGLTDDDEDTGPRWGSGRW